MLEKGVVNLVSKKKQFYIFLGIAIIILIIIGSVSAHILERQQNTSAEFAKASGPDHPENTPVEPANVNNDAQKVTTPVDQNAVPLAKFPDQGVPVLMFHSIKYIPGNSLGVPIEQFSEEMQWLKAQNYHTISPEQLYQALTNNALLPEKPVLLTFDDGYVDNYQSARPILQKNGYTATFFIISNWIGGGAMSWEQLIALVKADNSIGSHTVNHFDLATLSPAQQNVQLTKSKEILEQHLNTRVSALCFPSGKFNNNTLTIMPEVGYKLGFTTQQGKVRFGDNPLTLKRLRISGGMSIKSFKQLLP